MRTASVSNVELFRVWMADEDLDLNWILSRIQGKVVQTENMKVGEAFHKAIETSEYGESDELSAMGYTFQIQGDITVAVPKVRELSISKLYGDLQVRGRVDAIEGKTVIDHKTTGQFDADRLMSGYQWRYYLDMMDADTFRWNVFVLAETDDPNIYAVRDCHTLEQKRYPNLSADCEQLALDYNVFAGDFLRAPSVNPPTRRGTK